MLFCPHNIWPGVADSGDGTMLSLCVSTVDSNLLLIVRLLAILRLTGRLRVVQQHSTGDVFFDHGRVVAAALGEERGLPALEAILLGRVCKEGSAR